MTEVSGLVPRKKRLTDEDQDDLVEMLRNYQTAKRAGKWVAYIFMGTLGAVVLFSQFWDVVRRFFKM